VSDTINGGSTVVTPAGPDGRLGTCTADPPSPTTPVGAVVVTKVAGTVSAGYRVIERPTPGPGQLLIRPAYVGICGSDLEQLADHMPETFVINYPHVLGHEWSGEVVEVGPQVDDFEAGDRVIGHGDLGGNRWFGVTHDGAMAELFAVDGAVCLRLPAGMGLLSAALVEPFACVVEAIRKVGGVNAAHQVHVHGLGAIGLCAVIQAAITKASVVAIDPSHKRRELALSLGAELAVDPADTEAMTALAAGADVVVEASGAPPAQAAAVESGAADGRVLFMGVSVPRAVPARLGLIQQRNLTLTSSTGAPSGAWPSALRMLERHRVDLTPIVSTTFSFAECKEALARAADRGRETKVLLHP